MKTLILLCILAICFGYGCQLACSAGIITDTDEPGVKFVPPPQSKENSRRGAKHLNKEPQVIPGHIDMDSIITM